MYMEAVPNWDGLYLIRYLYRKFTYDLLHLTNATQYRPLTIHVGSDFDEWNSARRSCNTRPA